MATLLAPYNTAMQLGQGFNSFTQQLCVDRAVISDSDIKPTSKNELEERPVAQNVSYRLTVIDKVTDVTNAMNINAAFAIKYDAFNAKGKGEFIDTSKVKESDMSFMIQVKVINQVIYDNTLTKFNPIPELKGQNFAEIYGDCFISGFQDGGEFTAVISLKAKDRTKASKIKADAEIAFTKGKLEANLNGGFGKDANDLMTENETTISVVWTGGGQNLKNDTDDWTFATMRTAALKFPNLVAKTPIRTHVILTKFTALRSFYAATLGSAAVVPNFEQAGVYTSFLQEAYLDYKSIAKNLQVLTYDVSTGMQRLLPAAGDPALTKPSTNSSDAPTRADDDTKNDSDADAVMVPSGSSKTSKSVSFKQPTKPYPPTIAGLEQARQTVRQMLNRIVSEVDAVARKPEIAIDESRESPYMSAALFRDLLPRGEQVVAATVSTNPTAGSSDPDYASSLAGIADSSGGIARF